MYALRRRGVGTLQIVFKNRCKRTHGASGKRIPPIGMGELTASLAHEIKQPIAAAVMDAGTCVEWLARDKPDIEEARKVISRIIQDVTRASKTD